MEIDFSKVVGTMTVLVKNEAKMCKNISQQNVTSKDS